MENHVQGNAPILSVNVGDILMVLAVIAWLCLLQCYHSADSCALLYADPPGKISFDGNNMLTLGVSRIVFPLCMARSDLPITYNSS